MIRPFDKPIYVTRPFLPSLDDFCNGLKEIWESRLLTNNGPVLQRFGSKLSRYLETENISLFGNGTQALQVGLQGMEISGEVITTPFTFVATTHALQWNRIRPVFVDIEPEYYTLNPERVEEAISPSTTAILGVHVYGHPCKLDVLADIARRHHLRLIYDAAHAFGVKVGSTPIAHYGDLSMFSFHATKLFHSVEGGMLTFPDLQLGKIFDYLKNFGFKNEVEVVMTGTNAKMNEIQALMGEMVLDHITEIISARERLYRRYQELLRDVPGIKLPTRLPDGVTYNYAYIPIEIYEAELGISRDRFYEQLKKYNVFARRYFYPLLCDFACYKDVALTDPLTVARAVAGRILTLPIYYDLTLSDVERICDIVREIQKTRGKCQVLS
jgi:dTDP-4-amino-4,6-dideoxygalactose transaminase